MELLHRLHPVEKLTEITPFKDFKDILILYHGPIVYIPLTGVELNSFEFYSKYKVLA